MATDAQGRQLSDDGHYYWDGTAWQLVDQQGGNAAAGAQAAERTPTADDFKKVVGAQQMPGRGPEPE